MTDQPVGGNTFPLATKDCLGVFCDWGLCSMMFKLMCGHENGINLLSWHTIREIGRKIAGKAAKPLCRYLVGLHLVPNADRSKLFYTTSPILLKVAPLFAETNNIDNAPD